MRIITIIFITVACLFFQLPTNSLTENVETCIPNFKLKNGWFGGDGAYSVPLSRNKSLWLFGDSFAGKPSDDKRKNTRLVSNTIGISECTNNGWQIKYYWKNMGTDKSEAFFHQNNKNFRYWPIHGFLHLGKLYIALEQVVNTGEQNTFGFIITGVDIAVVNNPFDSPKNWKIEYQNLISGTTFIPGISFVKYGEYYYIYTVIDDEKFKKDHPIILMRINSAKLGNINLYLEFLTKNNNWEKNPSLERAKIIMEKGSSEISISYHNSLKKWIAVHTKTEFLSNEIVIKTSENPEGPWSDPVTIYKVPEMITGNDLYDNETFCYAGKAHEEFNSFVQSNIVITYACNSFNFSKLLENLNIYLPKTILIKDNNGFK